MELMELVRTTLFLTKTVVALAGLSQAHALYAGDTVQLSQAQVQSLGVETAPLADQQTAGLPSLPAQVVVPNNQMFVVSAPLAGLLEHISVAVNQPVKKGQPLARLQSPALADAQRGFLQAATQFQLAKENLERDDKLVKEGIIAESRYRAAKSQHTEAAAAFAERRQALKLAGMSEAAIERLQSAHALSNSIEIAAPIDGVVLEQLAMTGQRVEAAALLFKVARLEPLWLEIQVPVERLAGLAEGTKVTIPAYGAAGEVLSVGKSVSANQTVMVRAELSKGAQRLRPGQLVEATLAADAGSGNQWSVPNTALVRNEGKLLVFVQTSSGFRAQAVNLVSEGAGSSVISGNLRGDERVAVRGVAALKAKLIGIGGE